MRKITVYRFFWRPGQSYWPSPVQRLSLLYFPSSFFSAGHSCPLAQPRSPGPSGAKGSPEERLTAQQRTRGTTSRATRSSPGGSRLLLHGWLRLNSCRAGCGFLHQACCTGCWFFGHNRHVFGFFISFEAAAGFFETQSCVRKPPSNIRPFNIAFRHSSAIAVLRSFSSVQNFMSVGAS